MPDAVPPKAISGPLPISSNMNMLIQCWPDCVVMGLTHCEYPGAEYLLLT